MSGRQVLQSKYANEGRYYTFDFVSIIGTAGTISSAVTTCAVFSGVDAAPSSMLSGAAAITTAFSQVRQKIINGVEGCIYLITCTATMSTGEVLVVEGLLAVLPGP